ncbi:MAG: hypothetical protein HY927_15015 [Elusimicrobia bacterium]|nr:hypothetical protein [Elusimicrobiota bacterium]
MTRAIKLASLALLAPLAAWAGPGQSVETRPLPASPWGGKYAMTFTLPEKATKKPVPVTVAVVNPAYKGEDVDQSALADQAYTKVAKGFAASMGNDLDRALTAWGLTTMGPFPTRDDMTYTEKKDAEIVLVSKVFLVTEIKYLGDSRLYATGPAGNSVAGESLLAAVREFQAAYLKSGGSFASPKLEEAAKSWAGRACAGMPAAAAEEWAKRYSSGELVPLDDEKTRYRVSLQSGFKQGRPVGLPQDASFGLAHYERGFKMTTSGWMYFVMHEPLSGEKLWVKKLEFEPVQLDGVDVIIPTFETVQHSPALGISVPSGLSPDPRMVVPGRADVMATILQKLYPSILQKLEASLDPVELSELKQRAMEIRRHKAN